MQELADRIIDHYERHVLDWDVDRNLSANPWTTNRGMKRFVSALPAGVHLQAMATLGKSRRSEWSAIFSFNNGLDKHGVIYFIVSVFNLSLSTLVDLFMLL
jgi:hypothetical protein